MQANKSLLIWFIIFIALQPIIDALTALSILVLHTSITVGIIVRFLFMALSLLMLLLYFKQDKKARGYFFYLIGLALFILVNIAVNFMVKDPYYIVAELKFFNKVVYMPILLFGYLVVYRKLKETELDLSIRTEKMYLYASYIISIVMIVSLITGTSLKNYAHTKIGFTGWFYAGNEIGAIMAIILPLTALYAIRKTQRLKQAYYWIPFILLAFSMQMLGTKVGYGAIAIVLLIALASLFIFYIRDKKQPQHRANIIVTLGLLIVFVVTTPATPTFYNMNAHLSLLNIDFGAIFGGDDGEVDGEEGEEETTEEEERKKLENLVLSSRENYLADFQQEFKEAPLVQKLFGMGFAGNYDHDDEKLTMIEMDYFDIFFSFGILGFLYFIAPILFYLFLIIKRLFTRFKETFTIENILWATSLLLALGIGALAGHVFTAPAVSIYFAVGLVVLLVENKLIKE